MKTTRTIALGLAALFTLSACGGSNESGDAQSAERATITNCGKKESFPSPAQRIFAHDGPLIANMLALGAEDQVVAASSMQRDRDVLAKHYGAEAVDGLKQVSKEQPSLETILAQRPDVMLAGWNYGYTEDSGITPTTLRDKEIDPYILTESCRSSGTRRGIVDPWKAVRQDTTNLGVITGKQQRAKQLNADLDRRLKALAAKPSAKSKPEVFVFDSTKGSDVFSSGSYGAPDGIIRAAGGTNALSDLKDTWTSVSWERLTRSEPDAFVFVDYPPQTFAQKVRKLQQHPATKNLEAVRKKRFLNLPYAMWTSSPLNIDAAEQLRGKLESWGLQQKG